MQINSDIYWCGIFIDAYTYSTNYLLFTLTVVIASILCLWIYEKPQFYKLIFKMSKHSNTLSPVQSDEVLATNDNQFLVDGEVSDTVVQKSPMEICKDEIAFEKGSESFL